MAALQQKGKLAVAKGFTLLEIMVVVAIIAIIASIITPNFGYAKEKAHLVYVMQTEKQIAGAMELYFSDHHFYPPTTSDTFVTPALFGGPGNPYFNGYPTSVSFVGGDAGVQRPFQEWTGSPGTCWSRVAPCVYSIAEYDCVFDSSAIPKYIRDENGNPPAPGTKYGIIYEVPTGFLAVDATYAQCI